MKALLAALLAGIALAYAWLRARSRRRADETDRAAAIAREAQRTETVAADAAQAVAVREAVEVRDVALERAETDPAGLHADVMARARARIARSGPLAILLALSLASPARADCEMDMRVMDRYAVLLEADLALSRAATAAAERKLDAALAVVVTPAPEPDVWRTVALSAAGGAVVVLIVVGVAR